MPLFPDEDAIARAVMGPGRAKDWPEKARYLEDKHGLPRVNEMMGGRYWPAVVAFFDVRFGVKLDGALDEGQGGVPSLKSSPSVSPGIRVVPYRADGKEQFDGPETYPAPGRRHRDRSNR